jgi:Avidin family
MKKVFLALIVLLGFQSLALAQGLPAPSFWKNQRGSTLEVYFVDPSGSFQGQFINQAPGYKCQGIPYPAAGTSVGVDVIFSVKFVQCYSHATWFGVVNGNTITTNWILIYAPPNGPPQKSQGSDVFTRVR